MKHLIFFVFVLVASSAWAQAPKAPAKEPAKEPAKPAVQEPMKDAATPAPSKQAAARGSKPRRWNEDARHCLERPTNTEIIKCAEEYL